MKKILVSGLVNVETSLKIDNFPIFYNPIDYAFFKTATCVSGVGFNIALALKTLGSDVDLISLLANDDNGQYIKQIIKNKGINLSLIENDLKETPLSVVLVDEKGKRKIYCDLKDIQEKMIERTEKLIDEHDIFVLTNINFNRKFLLDVKRKNKIIASDVHCISTLDDDYNFDFMKMSNILFLSNEYVKGNEANFIKSIYEKFHNDIIVIGCGDEGALAFEGKNNKYFYSSAKAPLGIKSTVGAGDALFSAFLYFYSKGKNIQEALDLSTLFAGVKISAHGGSNGFISENALIDLLK